MNQTTHTQEKNKGNLLILQLEKADKEIAVSALCNNTGTRTLQCQTISQYHRKSTVHSNWPPMEHTPLKITGESSCILKLAYIDSNKILQTPLTILPSLLLQLNEGYKENMFHIFIIQWLPRWNILNVMHL